MSKFEVRNMRYLIESRKSRSAVDGASSGRAVETAIGRNLVRNGVRKSQSLSRASVWDGLAMDFGACNSLLYSYAEPLTGLNDLMSYEDDACCLFRLKKLRQIKFEKFFGGLSNIGNLPIEVRWFYRMYQLLEKYDPCVRMSEPLQAIYDLAADWGYIRNGAIAPSADIWLEPSTENLREACTFLQALYDYYHSQAFKTEWRQRTDQLRRTMGRLTLLTDSLLVAQSRFRVVPMDFGLNSIAPSGRGGAMTDFGLDEVVNCRSRLFNNLRFSKAFVCQGNGYMWHLEYNCQFGFYIRVFFMLLQTDLGSHEQFVARIVRLWQSITGGDGWYTDLKVKGHELAGLSAGVVDGGKKASVTRFKKAISYLVLKDQLMRVVVDRKHHVFDHSELPAVEGCVKGGAYDFYRSSNLAVTPRHFAPESGSGAYGLRHRDEISRSPFANFPLSYPILPAGVPIDRLQREYSETCVRGSEHSYASDLHYLQKIGSSL